MESSTDILFHPALVMLGSFALATIGLKIYSMTRPTVKDTERVQF